MNTTTGMSFGRYPLLVQQLLATCPVAYKLHVARDGEQALQMLADPNLKLDLIILDLNLPRITGLGVLEVCLLHSPQPEGCEPAPSPSCRFDRRHRGRFRILAGK